MCEVLEHKKGGGGLEDDKALMECRDATIGRQR
jgi:hypothetical protein